MGPGSGDRARVERFFARDLPATLAEHGAQKLKGTIAILVEGAGSWTLRLDTHEIVDEADPDADLLCVWTLTSFNKLLDGEKDLAAIRPVALVGDEKLLGRLGSLLVPPQRGGVNARLSALSTRKAA